VEGRPLPSELTLWDADTGQPKQLFRSSGALNGLAFSPDGKRIVCGAWDGADKNWEVATGQLVLQFEKHRLRVLSVACSPVGDRLATASADGTVKVWDAATAKAITPWRDTATRSCASLSAPMAKWLASGPGTGH